MLAMEASSMPRFAMVSGSPARIRVIYVTLPTNFVRFRPTWQDGRTRKPVDRWGLEGATRGVAPQAVRPLPRASSLRPVRVQAAEANCGQKGRRAEPIKSHADPVRFDLFA